ncbi:MAG: tetratricopeptide repeat protein [Deltaproteobacteria bacterium]|nr:tetratricopeptide repeat protein [Deltaproteobacteria bacterium]
MENLLYMFYRHPQFKISIFLIFITLSVFWQLPSHDFVNIDDSVYVTKNPYIKEGLTISSIKWAFTSFHAEFWHPVTWLSYMLDFELFRMSPGGYLVTNLLLHIASTILLFIFLSHATNSVWRSALAAALFSIHPLHVESVAWIAERKDLLSTFFWMLTMLFYARYAKRPNWIRYLAFSAFFLLGLMSKPMLVTLPFVLLLLDFWPLRRFDLFKKGISEKRFNQIKVVKAILEKVPLLIISTMFSIIALYAQKSGQGLASLEVFPFKTRIANALISYVSYLGKTFYPIRLTVFYPYEYQLQEWQIIISFLILISITIFAIHFAKRSPYLITGWLWYVGTLVPVIGIVKFGGAFSMADRYTYIPLIGIFIIIVWGAHDILVQINFRKVFISVLTCLFLLILMFTSWVQVSYWKNSITLFSHALHITNNNFLAHKNLGTAYINQGRLDLAFPHFQKAIKISPDNPTAHLNIGTSYLFYGEFKKAEKHYRKALDLNPNYPKARMNLDKALSAQKNNDLAISIVKTAIQLNKNDPIPHYNLANIYKVKGGLDKAAFHYRRALALKPDYVEAERGLEGIVANKRISLPKN